jgi:hypothetical protein
MVHRSRGKVSESFCFLARDKTEALAALKICKSESDGSKCVVYYEEDFSDKFYVTLSCFGSKWGVFGVRCYFYWGPRTMEWTLQRPLEKTLLRGRDLRQLVAAP